MARLACLLLPLLASPVASILPKGLQQLTADS